MSDAHHSFGSSPLPAGTRFAARVEYDGATYHGWQVQPQRDCPTVQAALEDALAQIANQPVVTACAGRTDTGVHGFAQIVHFDDPVGRSEKAWVMGTNTALPDTIRIHWAQPVAVDFHARFSAIARTYCYIIANTPVRPAQLAHSVTWVRRTLDAKAMDRAGQLLLGENDFSAFRAASCSANTPMRDVQSLTVSRRGDLVIIEITANAFLHHMVRNIVGSLIMVGAGLRETEWFRSVFHGRDRTRAADTAPAGGLYLTRVTYPDHFGLPSIPDGPMLLSALA